VESEKYNLNEETFNFIHDFEKKVKEDEIYTNKELVKQFESSSFYKVVVKSYYKTAIQKAIWWAVKRSNNWMMERGKYIKK
jgi:hypothetical protein